MSGNVLIILRIKNAISEKQRILQNLWSKPRNTEAKSPLINQATFVITHIFCK